jgi:hypothetical protein
LVLDDENVDLEAPFSEGEVKEAIFSSYVEGAPALMGCLFCFTTTFWEVIKGVLMRKFDDFYEGKLDLFRINFDVLTLIPKVEDSKDMKMFRPISLLNCSFKIFSKVLTLRLEKVSQRLVSKEQSAFIHGRYILKSVVVAHEIVHSIHRSKTPGVILKLDYEKAYDRVNIDFLVEILRLRGFGDKWIG